MNYRNQKLLDLAKDAPHCMCCKAPNHGQVVAAHSNRLKHGKGRGIKASDLPAYLCNECHDEIDGRSNLMRLSQRDRNAYWADAMFASFEWLLSTGRLVCAH